MQLQMTRYRARASLIAGAMAWPTITAVLAITAHDAVPAVLNGTAGPDDGLAALAAVLGLLVLGWLAAGVTTTALTQLLPDGGRAARAAQRLELVITPAMVRRLVTVAAAGALVSGAAPAQAVAPSTRSVATAVVSGPVDPLDPGWFQAGLPVPDSLDPGWAPIPRPQPPANVERPAPRATGIAPATAYHPETALDPSWGAQGRARSGAYPEEAVVVRRGDTLWDIAARHLGPAATDAEIARAWPHWFTANRAVIGADPDRLSPGQRLFPPAHRAGGMS